MRALFSREYLPVLLVNLLITIGGGAGYYLTSGYLPTFLKVVSKLPSDAASLILIAGSFVVIIASVMAGHLSTLWGRKRTFLILAVIRIVLLPFCYHRHGPHAGRRHAGVLGSAADLLRQCRLCADRHLPQRALPDRAARDRHRPVVEYRLRDRRHDADLRVRCSRRRRRELPKMLAIFSVGISVLFLAGAIIIPETKDNLR